MAKKKKMGRPVTVGNSTSLAKMLKQNGLTEESVDFNSRLAMYAVSMLQLREKAIKNRDKPDVLVECFYTYLQLSQEYGERITNLGAYMALGIPRDTAYQWRHKLRRGNDPRYAQLMEMVDAVCSMTREQLMAHNQLLPGVGIFWQKVYEGYSDQPQPEPEMIEDEEIKTAEQIKEQYKYLMPEEDPK